MSKVNFKIYGVIDRKTSSYNTHIAQYRSEGNQAMKFGQLIKYNVRNIFLQKS